MQRKLMARIRTTLAASSLALLLAWAPRASAQAVFGQILGTVTDSTGAAVPGADITVTDVSKGTTVTQQSNGAGEFTIEHLIPDVYTVKVEAKGFKGYQQSDLQVFADSSQKVTAVMTVGIRPAKRSRSTPMPVPQLKTDRADVATVFNAQEIEELPIPDHNFTNLQLLLPGARAAWLGARCV